MEETGPRPAVAGAVMLCIGGALLVVAIGFLSFAFTEYLRVDAWPDYPLSRLFAELGAPYPRLGFGQGAVDWLLSLGVCTAFFSAGALVTLLGGMMLLRHHRRHGLDEAAA